VLEQCYYHRHTYREVAAELGITIDGVKKHITTAMKHLRQHFNIDKQKK
jgi:RNA polymerase sigma-70 factor (ECF subfamily)